MRQYISGKFNGLNAIAVHFVDVITAVSWWRCIYAMEKSFKILRMLNNSRQTEESERERGGEREKLKEKGKQAAYLYN